MDHTTGLVAIVVLSLYLLYRQLPDRSQDQMEPPLVQHRIPFVGHILGMIWGKTEYYVQLR